MMVPLRPILLYAALALPTCDSPRTLDQYVEADEITPRYRGVIVKVHGYVAPASVARDSSGVHRFRVVRRQGGVDVTYADALPDRFQDKLEVIVTGTLGDDGTSMHATELVAKCPSDYEALPQWTADQAP
jgi:cytochrome c-type biogenesis protein CcmE